MAHPCYRGEVEYKVRKHFQTQPITIDKDVLRVYSNLLFLDSHKHSSNRSTSQTRNTKMFAALATLGNYVFCFSFLLVVKSFYNFIIIIIVIIFIILIVFNIIFRSRKLRRFLRKLFKRDHY